MKFKVGDKVKILDGSKIKNYMGGWEPEMKSYVGKVCTIQSVNPVARAVWLNENDFVWDERGLSLAESSESSIRIERYGRKIVAKLYSDEKVIRTGVAKCNPKDTFDYETGVRLALDRLFQFNWEEFESGKIAVRVSEDNFDDFVANAKKHNLVFKGSEDFNPFIASAVSGAIGALDILLRIFAKSDLSDNELYITYENDSLAFGHENNGHKEFVW